MSVIVPTREELELIREHVLLPIMLDVVQNNIDKLKYEKGSLKDLYIKAAHSMMDKIHKDLAEVNKEMRRIRIKVVEGDHQNASLHYTFWIRGYEDEFFMMKELVKSEISVRLGRYIEGMFKGR